MPSATHTTTPTSTVTRTPARAGNGAETGDVDEVSGGVDEAGGDGGGAEVGSNDGGDGDAGSDGRRATRTRRNGGAPADRRMPTIGEGPGFTPLVAPAVLLVGRRR